MALLDPVRNVSEENETLFDSSLTCSNKTVQNSLLPSISMEIYITKAVINCTILPILALIGLLGNISTAIAFYQRKKKNASSLFIIGLAVSDLLLLIFRCIANFYAIGHFYFTEKIRYVRPNSFCWTAASYSPQRSGNLFILAIVIERFTAVWFPLQLRQIWTKRTAHVIIVVIILLVMVDSASVVNILLFSLNEKIPTEGPISITSEAVRYARFTNPVIQKLASTLRILLDMIPHPFIFIFNLLILIAIRRSSMFRRGMRASIEMRKDGEQTKTKMLLGVTLLFIILCSPYYLYLYFTIFKVFKGSDVPVSVYESIKLLHFLNSAINFVVYGVSDSSLRGEYTKLLLCRRRRSSGASDSI